MKPYDHTEIEKKWQQRWEEGGIYTTKEDSAKQKEYVLDMFPYPSGEGLHVGHPKGYIATDVYARMRRMQGKTVLHPMGWDAFGLPAENYAIKTKTHPRQAVEKNVARYKEQLSMIGFSYDWSREINTTDPQYYRWTQWIFLKLFEKGLASQSYAPINWCPSCQTGLANEDLENGVCERCGSEVEKKPMRQWVLKIREYADRLLEDLDTLEEWPEHIKESQRNWIGRSEGATITFTLIPTGDERAVGSVEVFTTRPDTLFGATYVVLAPEHACIEKTKQHIQNLEQVNAYIQETKNKTEIDRAAVGKEKTGVELKGLFAINPATKEKIPVFIADYVLAHYGTGAIMAVPAHDERDNEFAKQFNLPIKQVIVPTFVDEGNPPQEGKEVVEREQIIGVVRNPKNNTYLCLRWKHEPWTTFVSGGAEDGEDIITSAEREIYEETGYKNLSFVTSVGCSQSTFYASHKGINRTANNTALLFDLVNDDRDTVSDEEKAKHDVVWLTPQEIEETDMRHAEFSFFWNSVIKESLQPYSGAGVLRDSGVFSGTDSETAKVKITEYVGGKITTTYRLQDWVFSRQRYWGEPIPIIHCDTCGAVPVPEHELPVVLPEVEHYEPSGTGESPLANIDEWVNAPCPKCGEMGKRETNTMPQWAGSCWYYLRFMDPKNETAAVGPSAEKLWSPVDVYVGGAEHATRHLIYARFWHKFLFDIGVVTHHEPFKQLRSVGLIQAEDGRKMSKRWGNVINPDDIVRSVGADSLRVYEMFMGPFENSIAWSTNGLVGARRFIERIWRLKQVVKKEEALGESVERELHKTIKKVGGDIVDFKFNTAISQMMIFLNVVEKEGSIEQNQFETLIKLLAPFAPHVAEELWEELGYTSSIHLEAWPSYDESKLAADAVELAVQVNGKMRGILATTPHATKEEVLKTLSSDTKLSQYLANTPKKVVYVPGRIINIVT